jgi:hypothetical protein
VTSRWQRYEKFWNEKRKGRDFLKTQQSVADSAANDAAQKYE